MVNLWPRIPQGERDQIIAKYGSLDRYVDRHYPTPNLRQVLRWTVASMWYYREYDRPMMVLTAFVIWPWASAGIFALLRATMRSARIRSVHVLRAATYSFDPLTLSALPFVVVLLAITLQQVLLGGGWARHDLAFTTLAFSTAVLFLLSIVKLYASFRLYLRLPHALGVLAASQVIALLLTAWLLSVLPWTKLMFLGLLNDAVRALRVA